MPDNNDAAPAESRLVDATEQQAQIILRLAGAVGFTLMANWDQLPTGVTRGLKLAEMGPAALVRSLALLLAGASAHLPDDDARLADVVELHVEMLRDAFASARAELKAGPTTVDLTASDAEILEAAERVKATPATPPRVLVPQPKLLM